MEVSDREELGMKGILRRVSLSAHRQCTVGDPGGVLSDRDRGVVACCVLSLKISEGADHTKTPGLDSFQRRSDVKRTGVI